MPRIGRCLLAIIAASAVLASVACSHSSDQSTPTASPTIEPLPAEEALDKSLDAMRKAGSVRLRMHLAIVRNGRSVEEDFDVGYAEGQTLYEQYVVTGDIDPDSAPQEALLLPNRVYIRAHEDSWYLADESAPLSQLADYFGFLDSDVPGYYGALGDYSIDFDLSGWDSLDGRLLVHLTGRSSTDGIPVDIECWLDETSYLPQRVTFKHVDPGFDYELTLDLDYDYGIEVPTPPAKACRWSECEASATN